MVRRQLVTRRVGSFVVAAALLFDAALKPTDAGATSPSDPAAASAWMPDVAERVASLRERTERAAAESRERRQSAQQLASEPWRSVALIVPAERPR